MATTRIKHVALRRHKFRKSPQSVRWECPTRGLNAFQRKSVLIFFKQLFCGFQIITCIIHNLHFHYSSIPNKYFTYINDNYCRVALSTDPQHGHKEALLVIIVGTWIHSIQDTFPQSFPGSSMKTLSFNSAPKIRVRYLKKSENWQKYWASV